MDLDGAIAVVSGSGGGIGRAIATRAAAAGAAVAVVDLSAPDAEATAELIRAAGGTALAIACDVSDASAPPMVFDRVAAELGDVTVLFNNAGMTVIGDAVAHSPEDYRRVMAVNVDAVWFFSREFVHRRRAKHSAGAIVNTASVNAFFVEPGYSAYCASKGAVLAMTRAMAMDHAREGIRINCICPGWTDTGMTGMVLDAQDDPALARKQAGKTHAAGRIGRPDEIAQAAVFLASEKASFFHGAAVVVDGGMSIGVAVDPWK